jgi:hypothetical protein
MEPIAFKDGVFVLSAEQEKSIRELSQRYLTSQRHEDHHMFAQTILGPIKTVADYEEWLGGLFVPQTRSMSDVVRIALDSPTAIGYYTSITSAPMYSRPGPKFTTTSLTAFDVALQIGFYDADMFGWPVLAKKIKECGMEMARKRDGIRKTAIDAAVAGLSGRTSTVATTMTKASIDAIFASAASAGFKIKEVRINPERIMDMTSWTWPSNSMWNRLGADRAEEVIRSGSITNYGDATWKAYLGCPTNKVYFFCEPDMLGWEHTVVGHPKTWTTMDINTKSDYTLYADFLGVYASAYGMWCLTIV